MVSIKDTMRKFHDVRKSNLCVNFLIKLVINLTSLLIVWPLLILTIIVKSCLARLIAGKIADTSSRHVVITGCDTGIGRQTAISLAKLGLQVHAGVYAPSSIADLRAEFGGSNLHIDLLDVTSDESVEKFGIALNRSIGSGHLWALINNAGQQGSVVDEQFLSIDEFKRLMDVNLYGSIRMVHLCRPLMDRKRAGGRIIFMLSMSSFYPVPYGSTYQTSKTALRGYVNSLRFELSGSKISVHSCTPAFIPTAITQSASPSFRSAVNKIDPEYRNLYSEDIMERRADCLDMLQELVILDNTVTMVTNEMINLVISTWPGCDVWVGWSWLVDKSVSLLPIEAAVWWVTFYARSLGDVSLDEILDKSDIASIRKIDE